MINRVFHNGREIEANEHSVDTPEEVMKFYKRHDGKFGYDVMIGATMYNIKSVKFSNNETEFVTKVSRA